MASEALLHPKGWKTDSRNVARSAAAKTLSVDRGGTVYQLAAFYNGAGRLVVARRNLTTLGPWELWIPASIQSASTGGIDDAHNTPGLGVDPSGIIHVAYDHHNDPLNYRRSVEPVESFDGTFGAKQNMVNAANEGQLTYPVFFTDPAGELYVTFRDGVSGDANLYLYAWDDVAGAWNAATGTGTDGLLIDGKASSVNPYWSFPPAFDADFGAGGLMHTFFNWRESSGESTNHDVCYVGWDGTSFFQADGTAQTVPVTEANAEVAIAVAESSGLHELTTAAGRTSAGSPLKTYRKHDASGDFQWFVAYRSGGAWAETKITSLSVADAADAERRGNLLVDWATDEAYLVLRVGQEYRAWKSDPGDYSVWTAQGAIHAPAEGIVGSLTALSRTPGHDQRRWETDGVWEGYFQRGVTTTS